MRIRPEILPPLPRQEVRLRYAYFIKLPSVVKDPKTGESSNCTAPTTRPPAAATLPMAARSRGRSTGFRRPTPSPAEVRLYDHLFKVPDPDDVPEGQDWKVNLNPNSLETVDRQTRAEPGRRRAGSRFQFERLGYFCVDPDSTPGKPVFNRTVTLARYLGED